MSGTSGPRTVRYPQASDTRLSLTAMARSTRAVEGCSIADGLSMNRQDRDLFIGIQKLFRAGAAGVVKLNQSCAGVRAAGALDGGRN
jgi:hypothetical protein